MLDEAPALPVAAVDVVAGVVEEDSQSGLGAVALGAAAGGQVLVVAREIAQHPDRHVPGEPEAHDRAVVAVVAGVVEAGTRGRNGSRTRC